MTGKRKPETFKELIAETRSDLKEAKEEISDAREEYQEARDEAKQARAAKKGHFSAVSDESGGCPNCGGHDFKAKRSRKSKAMLIPTAGVGALVAPKSRVRCTTCKTTYVRK